MLSFHLDNAIKIKKSVAGILEQYKSENEDSYAKDIEAVLTVFSPLDMTLLSSVVYWKNFKALEDILDAASNIEGLEKKLLTEDRFKGCDGKDYTLLGCAELCERAYCKNPNEKKAVKNMIDKIEERMKANGIPIPPKPHQAPDPAISSPKSPSFLSQHKKKIAIIGTLALVGTIVAFMSGHPAIGIIVALAAIFMLGTDKGRGMCDKVGSKISGMFSQSLQPKEQPANPLAK